MRYTAKIGDIVVAREPDVLEALALGSCIGCVIYDDISKIAAMTHILLPDSTQFDMVDKIGKYADTAIPEAIKLLKIKGAKFEHLKAKVAGGSRMFELTGKNSNTLDVGRRNTDAVMTALDKQNIRIVSQDVGNTYGRTIEFNIATSVLTIKLGLSKVVKQI